MTIPALKSTPAAKAHSLLAELSAARRAVLDAARALPPAHQDTPCVGVWSVKDLLAHLIGWDATNRQAIRDMLDGKYPSFFQDYDKDWQTYNAQLVQMHKKEPFSALVEAVEASHRQLLEFLHSVPAETLLSLKAARPNGKRTLTARFLLVAEARDERIHAAQLETFVKSLSIHTDLSGF